MKTGSGRQNWLEAVMWSLVLVVVVLGVLSVGARVVFRYSFDYGEATVVNSAYRLAEGQEIYKKSWEEPPFIILAYTPLYIFILSGLLRVWDQPFLLGRMVTVLSLVGSAMIIYFLQKYLTGSRKYAWVTVFLFAGHPYVWLWSSLARVDMLALMLSLLGLFIVVKGRGQDRSVVSGGLAMVGAFLTKQSFLLAAPLALAVWCYKLGFYLSLRLVVFLGVAAGAVVALLITETGGGFVKHAWLYPQLDFSWNQAAEGMVEFMIISWPLVVIAWLVWGRQKEDIRGSRLLLVSYLMGAVAIALTYGKAGSSWNYYLELVVALSLLIGYGFSNNKMWWRSKLRMAVFTLVAGWYTICGLAVGQSVVKGYQELPGLERLEEHVKSVKGDVLADDYSAVMLRAGKRIVFMPTEFGQMARAGIWDRRKIIKEIETGSFPLIIMHRTRKYGLWDSEVISAIEKHYQLHGWQNQAEIYLPRRQEGID